MKEDHPSQGPFRIGLHIWPTEAYYVHLNEAISRRLGDGRVPIEIIDPSVDLSADEQISLAEDILARSLDALICLGLPRPVLLRLLDAGLPIIYLFETDIRHPLFTAPVYLYEAGRIAVSFIVDKLAGHGHVLCVDGFMSQYPHSSRSRLAAIDDVLAPHPGLTVERVIAPWRYREALESLRSRLPALTRRPDAVIGISDVLVLAGIDAGRALGLVDKRTPSVGINGDPEALAAVADGTLSATVDTHVEVFAARAVELACTAAEGKALPAHYTLQPHLVTRRSVARAAAEELRALAGIASSQIGVNRYAEQARLKQLETSTAINRHLGPLLDTQQLDEQLAGLIRDAYGFDGVQVWRWQPDARRLTGEAGLAVCPGEVPIFDEALRSSAAISVPDRTRSQRFPSDARWPDTRCHIVLPIRLGDTVLGLLDLRSQQVRPGLGMELVGLQALADHLATALHNAQLYDEAVRAKAAAERADQLKTRLLANVSHELRTPLNVILGYSGAALAEPGPYESELPAELRADLGHIFMSGEHLLRLINDLLDLSRAEIGELELFPETVAVGPLLEEAFHSLAGSGLARPGVWWELRLPGDLPVLQVDPVRLRQILLNLLTNAAKFTVSGRITLAADVRSPYMHLAVSDTGPGIAAAEQELIFQPFVSLDPPGRRTHGIGLGLSITRRLVALHGGYLSLESRPGEGSTFHVYLPLPSLSETGTYAPPQAQPTILLVSGGHDAPEPVLELARRQGARVTPVHLNDDLEAVLSLGLPTMVAWDSSQATPGDWSLIEKLRLHPYLARLPFLLYGAGETRAGRAAAGATNVLLKASSSKVLIDAIRALRPRGAAGAALVVEDDLNARTLYRRLLAEALPGQSIREAESGQAALDVLAAESPAMVILDLVMPGIDGFAVLEHIRADRRIAHIPVLVMTGKLLSLADIRRLDFPRVAVQRKELLSEAELVQLLRKVFTGADALPQPTSGAVKQALAYLHENYQHHLSRAELANAVGVSESHLSRIFHQEIGLGPWEYLLRLRLQVARTLLVTTGASIIEIAADTGFSDPAYFSRVFARENGQSPLAYRKAWLTSTPS